MTEVHAPVTMSYLLAMEMHLRAIHPVELICYGRGPCAAAYGMPRPEANTLDAAWAEAEAALPEGTYLTLRGRRLSGWVSTDNLPSPGYHAAANTSKREIVDAGWHSTPAAALRALASKLRERQG